ncbi:hypothetical protein WA026_000292 [Henosepilachna vigintioctopunctata]|uniref:Uncharacterized protein n=1 Tax=Henosepilachna vigintioctopunctata TaxID=420089 RepID=A0AAW1V5K6_9CUCU
MLVNRAAVFPVIFVLITITKIGTGIPTSRPTVTNYDIRDAILQIVNVIRTTEDKLERHEYRERALGDQLKRGLSFIDKRVKQFEHFKGAITRLDERLAAVETILIQKEEKERLQSMKTFLAVDDIQKNLPLVMDDLKKDILDELSKQIERIPPPPPHPKPEITKTDFENLRNDLIKKVEKMNNSIVNLEKELKKTRADKEACEKFNKQIASNLKKIDTQFDNGKDLLQKYEHKLGEYKESTKESPAQLKEQADWQENFLKSLNEQKHSIADILSGVGNVSTKLNTLPKNDDIEKLNESTKNLVKDLQNSANVHTEKVIEVIGTKINDVKTKIAETNQEVKKTIDDLTNITKNIEVKLGENYKDIKTDLSSIKKTEEITIHTADNVLDTKRRLEYGVHQILGEMGQLMKTATKDIGETITDRFDVFELSVLDEENGALSNLTHKIGDDIDQVWRQIGIMHQKMNANAEILSKLQNQTDTYVNGSSDVMDNMKGKVAKITSKLMELDENLNYLLGRLMLVSHEFSQSKNGISKALDEIKGTFLEVQDKIKDSGPGPHKIDSYEEPDVSPAKK